MVDDWFVRVAEKEYGPVELETLLEWKAEGRLIPENEVRQDWDGTWLPAVQFPELFGHGKAATQTAHDPLFRRRTLSEIMGETLRIYGRGFVSFFLLSLFVALPSLAMQISFGYARFGQEGRTNGAVAAGVLGVISLAILLACWPIFVGGLQMLTAEIAAGRKANLREALTRAIGFWPRLARLSLHVYGSYLFWTLLPVILIVSLAASPSIFSIFIALLALAFQVYMASRLFVAFMFWQQSATIAGLEVREALVDSRETARSRPRAPWLERPVYRGAIIASVWLIVLILVSVVVEMPFTFVRLQGVSTMEDGMRIMQQLLSAPVPDTMTLASNVLSSLVHAALRPLLGIAFVVLYFDARAE